MYVFTRLNLVKISISLYTLCTTHDQVSILFDLSPLIRVSKFYLAFHHIARLAWLIQEYLLLVKKESGPTLKIQ